jgi:hypothetical protein
MSIPSCARIRALFQVVGPAMGGFVGRRFFNPHACRHGFPGVFLGSLSGIGGSGYAEVQPK